MKIFLTCFVLIILNVSDALAQQKPFVEVPFEFYGNFVVMIDYRSKLVTLERPFCKDRRCHGTSPWYLNGV